MVLVIPDLKYEMKFKAMMQDYWAHDEDTFSSPYYNENFDFIQYIKDIEDLSRGIGLPDGYVPTTEWWMVDSEENILGTVRIRHFLTERNSQEGGHIGYDISPNYRRQGYGIEILAFVLVKAKEMGMNKVLLTCDDDNIASIKIIEHNGGMFENAVLSRESNKRILRYWICL